MNQLKPLWLLIISASAALLGFIATVAMLASGYGSPALPSSSVITLLGVGLVVLGLGIAVWWDKRRVRNAAEKEQRTNKRNLHPIQAARVVAAGQACAYAGSLIAGWHVGILIDLAPAAGLSAPNASSSLVMIIGGLIWVIIGFVVEQLCRIPPDDDSPNEDRVSDDGSNGGHRQSRPHYGPEEGYARGTD